MSVVYRYIDASCEIIKYVGIVWSDGDNLLRRVKQHTYDQKFDGITWRIEYLDVEINSRTDAEYLEAHFISLYGTDKYLNSAKSRWGVSSFIPSDNLNWKQFTFRCMDDISMLSSYDIYNEIISCQSHDARQKTYMRYSKLVSSYSIDRWNDIKKE